MKNILLIAIFALTLNVAEAAEKKGDKTMKEEKSISFNKIIIYVKKDLCKKTFEFYKNGIGLKVVNTTPNHGWTEFNIDETSLCMHHDNFDEYPALARTGAFIVLNIRSMKKMEEIRNRLLPLCKQVDKKEPFAANEIGKIYLSKSTKFNWFRVGDPAENTVQFECNIK